MVSGFEKSKPLCIPEFMRTQSRSVCALVMLHCINTVRDNGGRLLVLLLLGDKVGDLVNLRDVEGDGTGLVLPMLVHELFKLLLSPSNSNDVGSFFN